MRTRIEGFTTDPSSFVMLRRIDVDPCTATESPSASTTWSASTRSAASRRPPRRAWHRRGRRPVAVASERRGRRSCRRRACCARRASTAHYFNWETGDTKTPSGTRGGHLRRAELRVHLPGESRHRQAARAEQLPGLPVPRNGTASIRRRPHPDEFGTRSVASRPARAVARGRRTRDAGLPGRRLVGSLHADRRRRAGPDREARRRRSRSTPPAAATRRCRRAMPLTFTWSQVSTAEADQSGAADPSASPTRRRSPRCRRRMTFQIDKFAAGGNIPDNTRADLQGRRRQLQRVVDSKARAARSSATMTCRIVKNPTPTDTLTGLTAIWRVQARAPRRQRDHQRPAGGADRRRLRRHGCRRCRLRPACRRRPETVRTRRSVSIPAPSEITVRSSLGAIVTVPVTVRP